MAESSRSSDSVEVGFGVAGEVEVNDNIDGHDVDSTGAQIGRDKTTAMSTTESMEDFVAIFLKHFGVDVIA